MTTEMQAEYRFDPNDPVTREIIAKAKALNEQPQEPQVDLLSSLPAST